MTMKDHEDVASFMAHFAKLKDMVDDPAGLVELAKTDDSVKEVCLEVHRAAFSLSLPEMAHHELFAAPADPKFISAWREYEEHFEAPIATVSFNDFLGGDLEGVTLTARERFDVQWKGAAASANEEIEQMRTMLRFVNDQIEMNSDHLDPDLIEEVEQGSIALKAYANLHGPKIGGVLRRRRLVPFTLIPRHVARKHGSEKMSLYTHLSQAQDAFVYGLPFAAIALLRSVVEIVLKHHYQAQGEKLEHMINSAKGLPAAANRARLHSIQHMANKILHFDRQAAIPDDQEEFDREIMGHLSVVRLLIEDAPDKVG